MNVIVRNLMWRIGRHLYSWARGDLINDPRVNGEYWLLRHAMASSEGATVFIDVGSHEGNWSVKALELAASHNRQVDLYAFEPGSETRNKLCARLADHPQVEVCAFAVSSHEGEAEFFSNPAGSGINSLNAVSGTQVEIVSLTTLDMFAARKGIRRIAMIKVDTEGFDFLVLQGAIGLLNGGSVDVVQFEYNWRWLLNGASLHGVFSLIENSPVRFGKLVGESIEFYDRWHFELDRYFENNYVLVRRGCSLEVLGRAVTFDENNVAVYDVAK